MLRTAPSFYIPAFLVAMLAASPAAGQSPGSGASEAPSCYRTIGAQSGAAQAEADRAAACTAPREMIVNGGRMAHAIMLTDISSDVRVVPTLTGALQNALRRGVPAFASPPRQH